MEPLKIGNITLPHRAVFGPMAGFTDAPCRRLMAQHGAGFTVSEMVSSRALVYGDHKTVSLLKAAPNGAPYGVQIFGEVPEIMGEATAAIEQYEFDFVDINMGCPAPKIVSGGAGSKLMLDPDRCGRIVEQVVAHTKRPVTVKMRKGWDADHITAVECAKACEQAGAALVTVNPEQADFPLTVARDEISNSAEYDTLLSGEKAAKIRLIVRRGGDKEALMKDFALSVKAGLDHTAPTLIRDVYFAANAQEPLRLLWGARETESIRLQNTLLPLTQALTNALAPRDTAGGISGGEDVPEHSAVTGLIFAGGLLLAGVVGYGLLLTGGHRHGKKT